MQQWFVKLSHPSLVRETFHRHDVGECQVSITVIERQRMMLSKCLEQKYLKHCMTSKTPHLCCVIKMTSTLPKYLLYQDKLSLSVRISFSKNIIIVAVDAL